MSIQALQAAYVGILKDLDPAFLDRTAERVQPLAKLSQIFLPSVAPEYFEAPNRIMIVGRETLGWDNQFPNDRPFDLSAYVETATNWHVEFFKRELAKKDVNKRTFHNFTRRVARRCGGEGVVYSNLYCFSWNKGNPAKHPEFETIKRLSGAILKAQIEHLQPQIVIFCCGRARHVVKTRQEHFPLNREDAVCMSLPDYPGIANGKLWPFMLNKTIRGFRVDHPSTTNAPGMRAHDFLIDEILPAA